MIGKIGLPDGVKLVAFDEIDSTNSEARRLALSEKGELLVVADSQSAGRGRLGRSFFSPDGGLYMSLLLRPDRNASDATLITTAAAVSVARAIDSLGAGESARIKWVNDIYLHARKVCGILVEGQLGSDGTLDFAILGIGVNLVPPDGGFPAEIADRAGVLFDSCDVKSVRERLAEAIVREFYSLYPRLDARDFIDEYRRRDFLVGREVHAVNTASGEARLATVEGIGDDFALLVRYSDGSRGELSSGEVSLKL